MSDIVWQLNALLLLVLSRAVSHFCDQIKRTVAKNSVVLDAILRVPHVDQIQNPKSAKYCRSSPSRLNNGYIVNVANVTNDAATAGSSRIRSVMGSAGIRIDFS